MTRTATWFVSMAIGMLFAGCNPQITVKMPEQEPLVDEEALQTTVDEALQWIVDQLIGSGAITPTTTTPAPTPEAPAQSEPDVVTDTPEPPAETEPVPTDPTAPETTPPTTEPAAPIEEPAPPAAETEPPQEQEEPVASCSGESIGVDGTFTAFGTIAPGTEVTGTMNIGLYGVCEPRMITHLRIGLYRVPPQGNISMHQDICAIFACDCTERACGPLGPFGIRDHSRSPIWLSPGFEEHPAMYSGMPFRPDAPNQPLELRAHEYLGLEVVGTIRPDAPAGTYYFALLDIQEMWPSGLHDFRQIGLVWSPFTIGGDEPETVPSCGSGPGIVSNLPFGETTYTNPDGDIRILDLTAVAPCTYDATWGTIEVVLYREFEGGPQEPASYCDVFHCADNADHPLRFTDAYGNPVGMSDAWLGLETRILGTPLDPNGAPIRVSAGNLDRLQLHAEVRDDAPPGTYTVNLQSLEITYGPFGHESGWAYTARTRLGTRVIVVE